MLKAFPLRIAKDTLGGIALGHMHFTGPSSWRSYERSQNDNPNPNPDRLQY